MHDEHKNASVISVLSHFPPVHTMATAEAPTVVALDKKTNPQPLTRAQVNKIKASNVHQVLGRNMLVDGFDIVRPLFFSLFQNLCIFHLRGHLVNLCFLRGFFSIIYCNICFVQLLFLHDLTLRTQSRFMI